MRDLNQTTVWIFCRVIDNFGDAGVAWRLAKNLHSEKNVQVVFVIDNFATLSCLEPAVNIQEKHQKINDIDIILWSDEKTLSGCLKKVSQPNLVIESFACELPDCVKEIIFQNKALWLNWEYLTAEEWAEDMHLLPSLQANGVNKYFYFMGFSDKSGGLLREKNLLPKPQKNLSGSLKTYIFAYSSIIWQKWFDCLADLPLNMHIDLAGNKIDIPKNMKQNNLLFQKTAFVPQSQFDDLLLQYDFLIVRGEDSFVRTQYTGKPFFWHIYPQENLAHIKKLHAFWHKVYAYFPPELSSAHSRLSDELNGAVVLDDEERKNNFMILFENFDKWQTAQQQWQAYLFRQKSANEKLIEWLKEQGTK